MSGVTLCTGTSPIQPVEGTQIMSVQTGHCSDCMCSTSGALCDGVMWANSESAP